jgi:hypothetical protein
MKRLSAIALSLGIVSASGAYLASAQSKRGASTYANQWLVVLSSSKEMGGKPPALKTLKSEGMDDNVDRLFSSQYKNLSPCLEIVIAGAFDDQAEAKEFSQNLKDLKIDNYIKNSGAFAGSMSEAAAMCREGASSEGAAAEDNSADLHWVLTANNYAFLQLSVPSAESSKLPAANKLKMRDEDYYYFWEQALKNSSLGSYTKGQKFQTYTEDGKKAASCSIKSFYWMSWGEPHFGWRQEFENSDEKPTEPGCGTPTLFAELTCDGDAGMIALEVGKHRSPFLARTEVTNSGAISAAKKLLQSAVYKTAKEEAEQEGEDGEFSVSEQVKLWEYTTAGKTYQQLEIHFIGNEEEGMCGANGYVDTKLVGVVEVVGGKASRVVHALEKIESESFSRAIDVKGDGKLEFIEKRYPDIRKLRSPNGSKISEMAKEFCDDPC